MSKGPPKKCFSGERRYIFRYSGELSAGEVIFRLLKLAAGGSMRPEATAWKYGKYRGDETDDEDGQSGGICQDKQGRQQGEF
jgi:hypothetical protein